MRFLEVTRSHFVGVVLFLGLLAMTARNAVDPDLWWHLRAGQWIVENGRIPHVDTFSFTRAGHAWIAHEWLSEVIFYQLWKHGGPIALIIFSAVVTSAGFMVLYLRCPGKRSLAAAATAIGALAAAPCWGVRPQMFTFACASLLLWLIWRGESRPALLLWIPPLFLLWLNLHGGFALALALLVAYGAGLLVEAALGTTPWRQARPILTRVLLLFLACVALVPLNPSGARLYRYPFDTVRSPTMRSFIVEWFSPNFHEALYLPFLVLCLLLLTAFASGRAKPKARVLVPVLFTLLAALDAVRHIPIFVLTAIPVLAGALPVRSGWREGFLRRAQSRPWLFFPAAIVTLMLIFVVVRWTILGRHQSALEAKEFPQKAVSFLRENQQPQRIFVYYDWGGYAIWKLYPEYRVFADGRADLYGDHLLESIRTLVQLRSGWQEIIQRWQIETVLIPPNCALAQALPLEPNWHVIFSDSKAILLVKGKNSVETPQSLVILPPKSEKMFPRDEPNLRN